MTASARIGRQFSQAKKTVAGARRRLGKVGKRALAGAAGAALLAGSIGRNIRERATDIRDYAFSNKRNSGEVVTMKKSTLIALLVALAAVAGVLGALYFYVLRRERELDEYEQLLFSEDFNDDLPEAQPAQAEEKD